MARHARRVADIGFDAISIEGALIASEIVAEVAATPSSAKSAADYGCPKGTTLGDEIARYFRIGQAHWQAFAKIERPTVTQTAAFARDLLRDAFGFSDFAGPVEHHEGSRRYRIALEAKDGRVPIVCAPPIQDGDGFARALSEFGDGEGGRARRSPVVLLQDWLNANTGFLWGLVFAGDRVRLMRDNASLTRPAWIEADLGAMFRDEMFADFTAWWLLTHASRFGAAGAPASDCSLERWREAGQRQGTAARERLREGVEAALQELGQGLVSTNPDVRARIENGSLDLQALFEELLRVVYRLIFLAVAEDRNLLHPASTPRRARDLYAGSYSFDHWRERSSRRTAYDAHHDAWEGMKVTFAALERGQPLLGLPALGGLFGGGQTPILREATIPNRNFLMAVYRLAFLDVDNQRTRINWRDMKTEEFGSVYESLLEIRPILRPNGDFQLKTGAKGNDRKTSGSYYTPDSLVECLLDSALNPVLERAEASGASPQEKVAAILDLKVIDPACGSGHFLLGAARRMADRVARLRNEDAGKEETQAALRDVVSRCIHGVDRNPMAVELAKVALWIESVSPGQPLGFLDANIRCGDALLGVFDLAVLEEGIPDEAYKPLTGDSKDAAKFYLKLNRDAKKGQGSFDFAGGGGFMPGKPIATGLGRIKAMPEDTVGQVEKKRQAFEAWKADPARYATEVACDLYMAAFLMPKTEVPLNYQRAMVPTTGDVRQKLAGGNVYGPLEGAAVETVKAARVLHWPLEFPDVMIANGGFHVVLGNPPWDQVEADPDEFFAETAPEVPAAKNKAEKDRLIAALEERSPVLFHQFRNYQHEVWSFQKFMHGSGRFPNSSYGRLNLSNLFVELSKDLLLRNGKVGLIVPAGLVSDDFSRPLFTNLMNTERLESFYAFENEEKLFEGIANVVRFALLTICDGGQSKAIFAFYLRKASDVESHARKFSLNINDIRTINPEADSCPVFRTGKDFEFTRAISARVRNFGSPEAKSEWGSSYMLMFMMNEASKNFVEFEKGTTGEQELDGVRYHPLYEGKFFSHFDHRFGSYSLVGLEKGKGGRGLPHTPKAMYCDPDFEISPRYWIAADAVEKRLQSRWERNWLLAWRDVANAKVERTVVASIIPKCGVGHTAALLFTDQKPVLAGALLGNLNSITLDFIARQKVAGTHLTFGYMDQLPILPPSAYDQAALAFIVPRVLELTYTSYSMAPFARDLGYEGEPFAWDEGRRAHLRAELDAWYALAYGLTRDELRYVLDPKDVMGEDYPSETFRVLQKNEMAKYGEYRTRRLVLSAYDELMSDGMRPRVEGYG